MRRTAIAAAWIIGAIVPLVMSAVFVFGCCVLPFHAVIHKAMPYCHVAADIMRGESRPHEPSAPARAKQEPVKPLATHAPRSSPLALTAAPQRRVAAEGASGYRSFISLGAMRCDRDIGLHILVAALLI